MPEIMSNEEVKQLGIYAGIAAGGTTLGLAYGADVFSPNYKSDKKAATAATKAKMKAAKQKAQAVVMPQEKAPSTKEKAVADAVAENEARSTKAMRDQAFEDIVASENARTDTSTRRGRKNWYRGLDSEQKGYVDVGLAKDKADMAYIMNSDPETRQIMKDAQWYKDNKMGNQSAGNGGRKGFRQRLVKAASVVL